MTFRGGSQFAAAVNLAGTGAGTADLVTFANGMTFDAEIYLGAKAAVDVLYQQGTVVLTGTIPLVAGVAPVLSLHSSGTAGGTLQLVRTGAGTLGGYVKGRGYVGA